MTLGGYEGCRIFYYVFLYFSMNNIKEYTMLLARAEAQLRYISATKTVASPSEELLHELSIYQIELEMQNDELRHAYSALDESLANYTNLYELAPVAYLTLSHKGLITNINITGATLLGVKTNDLINRHFATLVTPTEADRWYLLFKEIIQSSEKSQNFEIAIQRPDNSVIHTQINSMLVTTINKPLVYITLTDLTEHKQTQQLLRDKALVEQALAEQRRFVGLVSHELRSPLSVISMAAQLLSIKISPASDCSPIIARIQRGVMRLAKFLDNCLTGERLNSQNLSLEIATINLYELTASIKNSVTLTAEAHQITTEFDSSLPILEADSQLLRILLLNLLENAIKYSPSGSEIRLCISANDQFCIFKIIDQGPGIPAKDLPMIFQNDVRGRNTVGIPGAGLGLAWAKAIVDLHNGSIEINSHVNIGSCITVTLPLKIAINS